MDESSADDATRHGRRERSATMTEPADDEPIGRRSRIDRVWTALCLLAALLLIAVGALVAVAGQADDSPGLGGLGLLNGLVGVVLAVRTVRRSGGQGRREG